GRGQDAGDFIHGRYADVGNTGRMSVPRAGTAQTSWSIASCPSQRPCLGVFRGLGVKYTASSAWNLEMIRILTGSSDENPNVNLKRRRRPLQGADTSLGERFDYHIPKERRARQQVKTERPARVELIYKVFRSAGIAVQFPGARLQVRARHDDKLLILPENANLVRSDLDGEQPPGPVGFSRL